MARIQQDQFIDEDEEEEVCPLCVEEFDLGDRYFKPCPCGYQICQFCYNNIKTTMNGLCPACRRPYDDKPYSFKNVTQEELLQHEKNKAAQQKKRAAAKQKEAQKREADNLSRKHLAGLRVRQRNLVYVTGMRPKIQGDRVAELLRNKEYFGQYGEIIKIVVSKSKDVAHTPNQPVGIYVTFARKEDAAACIEAINERSASQSGDGKVRAQHGTTKYCSAYLRGETCNNRSCMFLHEPGESAESFTRQDLSNMNAISTQQPSGLDDESTPQAPPQHAQPVAAAVQDTSPSSPSAEASALPPAAGWANAVRRGSRGTSSSMASPVVTNTTLAQGNDKSGGDASNGKSSKDASSESAPSRPSSSASMPKKQKKTREQAAFDNLLKVAFDPNMRFIFSTKSLSEEDHKLLETLPLLWDPQGGVKRRMMKEKEQEELRKQQEEQAALQEAKPEVAEQTEVERGGGSLQLGGEPEERPERAFGQQSAIQPPGFPMGAQFSLQSDLAGLNLRPGGATAAQQHQSQMLLRQFQAAGGTGSHQIGGGGHGRQSSRFGFNETGGIKAGASLQQPKNLGGFVNAAVQQQVPYYSGVQGPPPGLKTTGTPPVNGSGMFGQGHGFTSAINYGDARAQQPSRGGGGQDQIKREFNMFPFSHNTSASSTPAPAAGPYAYPGAGAGGGENSNPKKNKKGKKHRHGGANSSGANTVGEDPSIMQARPYGAAPGFGGAPGGGLYAAGGGYGHDLPALGQSTTSGRATPVLPPGLDVSRRGTPSVPPGLDVVSRTGTPKLPPGLFPAATAATEEAKAEELPEKKSAETQPKVVQEEKPVMAEVATTKKQQDVKGKAPVVESAPATSAAAVERDPTPAESMASVRKGGRQASVKVAKKTATPTPETPAKPKEATPPPPSASAKASPEKQVQASTPASKRPHPGKLNLDTTPEVVKKEESPVIPSAGSKIDTTLPRTSRAPSLSVASLSSRPGTPLASATLATGSPLKRAVQPRTLRITDTPKTEVPPFIPAAVATPKTETPPLPPVPPLSSLPAKIISRRTSVASLNQPGTPATERTNDTMSVTSASASRASSPPPTSSVGPVVGKKSRRKEQAKKEKERAVEKILASKEEVKEEIAPIMARKTKSARKGKGPVAVAAPAGGKVVKGKGKEKEKEAVVREEKVEIPVAEAARVEEVPKVESPATPAVREEEPVQAVMPPKMEHAESTPPPPPSPPAATQLTAAAILQALESTHQLALNTLTLLKPLTNSQSELKKLGMDPFTSADLANHIEQLRYELGKADESLLRQGDAVRRDLSGSAVAGKDRVSGRVMVTPGGRRLSCLTQEEEERYLELERRRFTERGIGRWSGGEHSTVPWQPTKMQRGKLQGLWGQEDILRQLGVATHSLEEALRDASARAPMPHPNPNTAGQHGLQPPALHPGMTSRSQSVDPMSDAREYVNRFCPRMMDALNPSFVAVPPEEEIEDDPLRPGNGLTPASAATLAANNAAMAWNAPPVMGTDVEELHPIDEAARVGWAAGRAARDAWVETMDPELQEKLRPRIDPVPRGGEVPTTLPMPSMSLEAGNTTTAAAMDTLKEAMATAGAIAKLGASEALRDPREVLKQWDRAVAGSGMPKGLQSAMEKVIRDVGGGSGSGSGKKGSMPMSMAELEREGLRERVGEARREAAEWERRLNKVVRGNRKAVMGSH